MASPFSLPLPITLIITFFITSQAIVPSSQIFQNVNQGDFGEEAVEYSTTYRDTNIFTVPFMFAVCFYNSTPNSFILGIKMGRRRGESVNKWVWDANRGKPVKENATLTFGSNGNLVLADVDGTVAWQTNTANKDVVGLSLLGNGNLVLFDSKGNYVWQSFNYPSDSLLVGQSLKSPGGPTRLMSRSSAAQPLNGPYSFVMEKKAWALYFQPPNSQKPLLYYRQDMIGNVGDSFRSLEFFIEKEIGEENAFQLGFRINFTNSDGLGVFALAWPKYNSSTTALRVDMDGNLRMHTYRESLEGKAWEVTYSLFDRNGQDRECKLPRRCGSLGVCDENQCVACPRPQGLLGWSRACAPPVLPPCRGGANVDFYKVEGVEHYTSQYEEGMGGLTVAQCKDRCSKDCKCLGLFYRAESSKCLLVADLGTLIKTTNVAHSGYIKISK